jgi:hypothetical protein
MHTVTPTSESLIGSLCREMDALRSRGAQVMGDLRHCRQETLRRRLRQELQGLQHRRQELRQSLEVLQGCGLSDPVGFAFLSELVRRPLACGERAG